MPQVLTVDFETYYDREYSLSKITTEQYVRNPLYETIGVSVQKDGGYPVWFSGTHKQTKEFLHSFPWDECAVLAHNAVFDMSILNWHYDIRPKRILDTLSMARAMGHGSVSLKTLAEQYDLGAKGTEVVNALGKRREDFTRQELDVYGAYCRNDVRLTYDLLHVLAAQGFPKDEYKLIDLTIRMFTEPKLRLDVGVLNDHLTSVQDAKAALMDKLNYEKAELMSNPKLAALLEFHGVEVPMKESPTTGRETYAFAKNDEAFKALLEHENPQVQAIVAARLGVKSTLEETRTERLIGIAKRGAMPIPLRYYAAHTGRWGGDDKVNMQNLPRSSPLKRAILPPEGYVFVDSDSSQIEARTLAWLAGQDDLVAAFDAGEDVYSIMAAIIYGKDVKDVTKDERFVGKQTILGCGYGMGPDKFKAQLKTFNVDVSLEECRRIIDTYRETYDCIPLLWKEADLALRAIYRDKSRGLGRDDMLYADGLDGIMLPNGLHLRYPGIENTTAGFVYYSQRGRVKIATKIYGGKVVENVCQALARIVIGEQMLAVAKKYPVVMTVHDAIGIIAPEAEAKEAKAYVEKCMRLRPTWAPELPLNCEAGYGPSYGECK